MGADVLNADDRYIVISADCHGGGSIEGYRALSRRAVARRVRRMGRRLRDALRGPARRQGPSATGTPIAAAATSRPTAGRRDHLPQHGAAVLPEGVVDDPTAGDAAATCERRWAGLQAHNRWLVDFCADTPGRRAGIAQITLHDIERSVAEIRWAHDAGLRGGVLLPGTPPGLGLPQLFDPLLRPAVAGVRRARHAGQSPHRQRGSPTMGPTDVDAVDVPARGVVVGAPRAHAPHRRRCARTPPRHAVGVHRAGHRVGARRARRSSTTSSTAWRNAGRFAGAGVGPRRGRAAVAEAQRVLGAAVPRRRELHPPARGADARRGRRRPHHVGQRLPAQRIEPAVLARGDTR